MTLLLAGGAVWLFLAAIPVLADNGPHIASVNNGSGGINADSCAGCHRAHTAQGYDLTAADGAQLCLVCHGASGTGATTDVQTGVQYAAGGSPTRGSSIVSGLRGGGFDQARIGSGTPTRLTRQATGQAGRDFTGLVPVASTGTATTSRHMNLNGTAFGPGVAWGNATTGVFWSTPYSGPTVSITCTTCHNPHGNGKYRILNPIPFGGASTADNAAVAAGFAPATLAANVTDAAAVPSGQTRNYTNTPAQYLSGIGSSRQDYWRYCTPTWNSCSSANRGDKPNQLPSSPFRTQISAWCSTCHTRYTADAGSATYEGGPSGDAIFAFRHTTPTPECTQCHVAHGSNAAMSGTYSSTFPYPHDPAASSGTYVSSASSRLLKIDNRGTCQMCHDPTGTTTTVGTQVGAPVP